MFGSGMTNEQFNAHLELLAKLIEKTATSVEDAAQIIRNAKIEIHEDKSAGLFGSLNFAAENLALPEIHVKNEPANKHNREKT